MDKPTVCPLNPRFFCKEKDCGWWSEKEYRCSIVVISEALDRIVWELTYDKRR